jgi:hypothetical protein
MIAISTLKQATFLTTRTARVTLKDWVKNVDWLMTSNLLPVNVRVVKNVSCLSSVISFLWRKFTCGYAQMHALVRFPNYILD